jgi:hypothetical protein
MNVDYNGGKDPWVETFRGHKFHILNPKPEEIDIKDIAHSLAMQCRFTGHVKTFYSIAEHCIHVSHLCSKEYALEGLLHDASEAYLSDLNRPAKHFTLIKEPYIELENKITNAIYSKFNVIPVDKSAIKAVDNIMLGLEARKLMRNVGGWADDFPITDIKLYCWSTAQAEKEYIKRFKQLTKKKR